MPPGQAPPALRRANAATVANRAAPNTAMVVAAGICECAVNANTSSTTGGADRMTYRLGVSDLSTPSGHGPERRPPAELLAQRGASGHTEDVGHGQSGEDHRDRAGLLGPRSSDWSGGVVSGEKCSIGG